MPKPLKPYDAPCDSNCAVCVAKRATGEACVGIKKKWTILIPSDDYLLDPEIMFWIAEATKKLRGELDISRRDYADRMAGSLMLFEGGLKYRGGLPMVLKSDVVGRAYGDDFSFRWMSKLEGMDEPPEQCGKHTMARRYRVHHATVGIRRPCWLDTLPK